MACRCCGVARCAADGPSGLDGRRAGGRLARRSSCPRRIDRRSAPWATLARGARSLAADAGPIRRDDRRARAGKCRGGPIERCPCAESGLRRRRVANISPWLNNTLVRATATHVIDQNLELLAPLGIKPANTFGFDLPERAEDGRWAEQAIGQMIGSARLALINPGAGWPSSSGRPSDLCGGRTFGTRPWPGQPGRLGRAIKSTPGRERLSAAPPAGLVWLRPPRFVNWRLSPGGRSCSSAPLGRCIWPRPWALPASACLAQCLPSGTGLTAQGTSRSGRGSPGRAASGERPTTTRCWRSTFLVSPPLATRSSPGGAGRRRLSFDSFASRPALPFVAAGRSGC